MFQNQSINNCCDLHLWPYNSKIHRGLSSSFSYGITNQTMIDRYHILFKRYPYKTKCCHNFFVSNAFVTMTFDLVIFKSLELFFSFHGGIINPNFIKDSLRCKQILSRNQNIDIWILKEPWAITAIILYNKFWNLLWIYLVQTLNLMEI